MGRGPQMEETSSAALIACGRCEMVPGAGVEPA